MISFMHTIPQIRDREKTVTRRLGWWNLKPGQRLVACEKCMGLGKGGKVRKMGVIEVVSVRAEQLGAITAADCIAEGFPDKSPVQFVRFFCEAMPRWKPKPPESKQEEPRGWQKTTARTVVNRIEFKYISCTYDTDGDGNCHRCFRQGGCTMLREQITERGVAETEPEKHHAVL